MAAPDCLNFGDPEKPDAFWQLSEAVRGIADAARTLGLPVVSGNVSLYADELMLRHLSELSVQHNYSGDDLLSLVAAQINSSRHGDYFALLAYLPPTSSQRDRELGH